jgi:hypothetical protein
MYVQPLAVSDVNRVAGVVNAVHVHDDGTVYGEHKVCHYCASGSHLTRHFPQRRVTLGRMVLLLAIEITFYISRYLMIVLE